MVFPEEWGLEAFKWISRRMAECYGIGSPLNFTPDHFNETEHDHDDDKKWKAFECVPAKEVA